MFAFRYEIISRNNKMMAVLDRILWWHGAGCLRKIGRKWGDIKADEGMITFSEAFGRGYQKENDT